MSREDIATVDVAARLDGLAATCMLLWKQFTDEEDGFRFPDRIVSDVLFSMQKQLEELSTTVLNREFVPEEGE